MTTKQFATGALPPPGARWQMGDVVQTSSLVDDAQAAPTSLDTSEFRRLVSEHAQASTAGTVPQTSATWAALVDYVNKHLATPAAHESTALPQADTQYAGLTHEQIFQRGRLAALEDYRPFVEGNVRDADRWNWCVIHQGKFNKIYRRWLEQEGSKGELDAEIDAAIAATPRPES